MASKTSFTGKDLRLATKRGKAQLVQQILDSGVDPNTADENRWTPLMEASRKVRGNIVKMLLEARANPNVVDKYGNTALLEISGTEYFRKGYTHAEIVGALLASRADPNIQGNRNNTALMSAAYWGRTNIVKMLLNARADPNLMSIEGDTALTIASRPRSYRGPNEYKYTETVNVLLAFGADPDLES